MEQASKSTNTENLEDLVKNFMCQVNNSDWLKQNTAEKWEKENPELAAVYKNNIKSTNETGTNTILQQSSLTGDEKQSV